MAIVGKGFTAGGVQNYPPTPVSLLPWAAFLHRWNWSLSVGDAKRLWVWLNIFICDLDDGIKGGLS